MAEVIVALDVPTDREAMALVDELGDDADFYKVGLELYTAAGPDVVRVLRARGKRVFLDLKMHDIPNTVARAAAQAAELDVDLMTVHAAGGEAMIRAASQAVEGHVRVVAVTVLTSLAAEELGTVWGREVAGVTDEVLRLARLARDAGADGVVAAVSEAEAIRQRVGEDCLLVVPGIRPAGSDRQDQKRVATPGEAVAAGATHLVVGRPVTRAADPSSALRSLLGEVGDPTSVRAPR